MLGPGSEPSALRHRRERSCDERLAREPDTAIKMLTRTGPRAATSDESEHKSFERLIASNRFVGQRAVQTKPRAVGDHASLRCDAGEGLNPPANRFNERDATTSVRGRISFVVSVEMLQLIHVIHGQTERSAHARLGNIAPPVQPLEAGAIGEMKPRHGIERSAAAFRMKKVVGAQAGSTRSPGSTRACSRRGQVRSRG